MYVKSSKINILALWLQTNTDYIGCVLEDGTPVALCTKEKWNALRNVTLKSDWENNAKIFDAPVEVNSDYTEKILKETGLFKGTSFELKCPDFILEQIKDKIVEV